jgi:hypothetical protein
MFPPSISFFLCLPLSIRRITSLSLRPKGRVYPEYQPISIKLLLIWYASVKDWYASVNGSFDHFLGLKRAISLSARH